MEKLIKLYAWWAGEKSSTIEKSEGAGSNRVYYRFGNKSGQSVIVVIGTSRDENHAFIYLTEYSTVRQLPVPQILAVSNDELRYLQTDLGHTSLSDMLKSAHDTGGRYTQKERQLLTKTFQALPEMQVREAVGLDFQQCHPRPRFSAESVLFDLNYLKYCLLKATGTDFHELMLEANSRIFVKDLTAKPAGCFLYRGPRAHNVMLDNDGNPYFTDYQGGRKGPCYYGLASFLRQASARYPFKLRCDLVSAYYESLKQYTEAPSSRHFVERLSLSALFHALQVLGTYGSHGYFERKKHSI